jgi:hypothetical protein
MTVTDLRAVLDRMPPHAVVVVAGHGELSFVTTGAKDDHGTACILYVQEPVMVESPAAEPAGAPA